jgi:hypothetical protein
MTIDQRFLALRVKLIHKRRCIISTQYARRPTPAIPPSDAEIIQTQFLRAKKIWVQMRPEARQLMREYIDQLVMDAGRRNGFG